MTILRDDSMFPDRFAVLEQYACWSLETEHERNAKRISSPMQEIQSFYDAMFPHMPAIMDYLGPLDLRKLPQPERRLLWLVLSLMEVSAAVELFSAPDVPFAVAADRIMVLQP